MTRWLAIAAAVIVLDQASKFAMTQWLADGQNLVVTSFFNLVLWHNSGAAFSFLAGAAGWNGRGPGWPTRTGCQRSRL